jgi:hypothetical protein
VRLPLGEVPELAHTPSRFEPPALGMLKESLDREL